MGAYCALQFGMEEQPGILEGHMVGRVCFHFVMLTEQLHKGVVLLLKYPF